jgi:hypothetical protein
MEILVFWGVSARPVVFWGVLSISLVFWGVPRIPNPKFHMECPHVVGHNSQMLTIFLGIFLDKLSGILLEAGLQMYLANALGEKD